VFTVNLLKILCWIVGHIPLNFSLWSGRVLGRIGFYLDARHRGIVLNNLKTSFEGEKTDDELNVIARTVFENLGMDLMEFCRLPWLKEEVLKGYVECEGLENFKRMHDRGKGIIFLTGHLGNWELMAIFYALNGYPVDIVVRDLDSPAIDEFVRWVRTKAGNRIISKGRSMRELLKILSEGGIVGFYLTRMFRGARGYSFTFLTGLHAQIRGLPLWPWQAGPRLYLPL